MGVVASFLFGQPGNFMEDLLCIYIYITSLLSYGLHFLRGLCQMDPFLPKKMGCAAAPNDWNPKGSAFYGSGTMELEWNLPVRQGWLSVVGICNLTNRNVHTRQQTRKQQNVRGGPNYKVQLLADFVLPDLVLSHELLGVKVLTRMLTWWWWSLIVTLNSE